MNQTMQEPLNLGDEFIKTITVFIKRIAVVMTPTY